MPERFTPTTPSMASSAPGFGHGQLDAGRDRVGRGDDGFDGGRVDLQARQCGEHRGGPGIGEDGDRGHDRDAEPERSGRRHEPLDVGGGAHMVEHGDARSGPLLLDQSSRSEVDRGCVRGLRDGHRQPHRGGQCGQPGAVQVEHLGDVGAYVERSSVPGHAQHRRESVVAEAAQLLLQDDAVPVAAREGDPGMHAAVGDHPGQQAGREVRTILMITDQHRIATRRQYLGRRRQRGRVRGRGAQVGEHQRGPHRVLVTPGTTTPAPDRPDRRRRRAAAPSRTSRRRVRPRTARRSSSSGQDGAASGSPTQVRAARRQPVTSDGGADRRYCEDQQVPPGKVLECEGTVLMPSISRAAAWIGLALIVAVSACGQVPNMPEPGQPVTPVVSPSPTGQRPASSPSATRSSAPSATIIGTSDGDCGAQAARSGRRPPQRVRLRGRSTIPPT